jgi:hypothetical protein
MKGWHTGKCMESGLTEPNADGTCAAGSVETKTHPRTGKQLAQACCDRSQEISTAVQPTGDRFYTLHFPNGTQVKVDVGLFVFELKLRILTQETCPLTVKDMQTSKTYNLTEFQINAIEKAYKDYSGLEAGLCGALQTCNKV